MNRAFLAVAAGAFVACSATASLPALAQQAQPQAGQQQASQNVFDALSSDPRFTTTMKMIYVAGASERMELANGLTIFAATDEAWDNSPYEGMLSSLTSTGATSEFPQSGSILQVLRGFIVRGEPTMANSQDVRMESRAGRPIEFDKGAGTVKWVDADGNAHSAKLAGQPIQASNGIIYPVNEVVGS